MSDAYAQLREAVLKKLQVVAEYDGRPREFCPHVLGLKNGRRRCLAFQFAGESSSGSTRPAPETWRCFDVDRLVVLRVRPGPWFSAPERRPGQTCVDEVDVDADRPVFTLIRGFKR